MKYQPYKPSFAVVIPTYGQYRYCREAVKSLIDNKIDSHYLNVMVIDDASPQPEIEFMRMAHELQAYAKKTGAQVVLKRNDTNQQLTKVWEDGLNYFLHRFLSHQDIVCVTNDDVLFPPGYHESFSTALKQFKLVGPVSNAPGTEQAQYVGPLLAGDGYSPETAYDRYQEHAALLYKRRMPSVETHAINGFCMVANVQFWQSCRRPEVGTIFDSNILYNSKGERNPTPGMTLQEYELQGRMRSKNPKFNVGIVSSCYVYHFRSVTRGDLHKKGDWSRLATA